MQKKIWAAALAAASMLVGFGAGADLVRTARADTGTGPSTSCGTSTPCLTESNIAGGPGVKSTSAKGNGLVATTNAVGSSSQNAGNALLGQDLQTKTGNGVTNAGVRGTSTNGTGVLGLGQVGLSGLTSSGTGVGVLASAPAGGTLFEGSSGGSNVFSVAGSGLATFGQVGSGSAGLVVNQTCGSGNPMYKGNSSGTLTFEVSDCGLVYSTQQIQVPKLAVDQITNRITGADVSVFAPLFVDSFATGDTLESVSNNVGGTNYVASDAAGVTWFYQGFSTTAGKDTIEMGDSGSVYARIFITMSESRVAQQTSTGRRVDTYDPQMTQPSLEDFGEAQLVDGDADVALDPKFASAIDDTVRYFVTLTPEGDCRGLYVAQRTPSGFTVRELQGGHSSIAFTYRIVAKPLGDESPRMPDSTLPYEFVHRVPPPPTHLPHRRAP